MSVEAMGGWSVRHTVNRSFVRSALIMAACISVVAALLCLLAIALEQSGSGGPLGVAAAAGVCLFGGLAAEGIAALVHRTASALVAMLVGMALRLLPPLVVCLRIAVRESGREHLAFIVYLLMFYFITLALDTWWAVQRIAERSTQPNNRSL